MNAFYPGETVHAYIVDITSSSGAIIDPTPLLFTYWPHGGTGTVATTSGSVITKDSSGNYHAEVVPTTAQSGEWFYRWSSTGTYKFVQWNYFRVMDVPAST